MARHAAAKTAAFLRWTDALRDASSPCHDAAVSQLANLPSPVLSEVLRSVDPIVNPDLDIAHGLTVSQGHAQVTDVGKLMDRFGMRLHHVRVLQGVMAILHLRERQQHEQQPSGPHGREDGRRHYFALRPADFDAMLRCVGAAVDFRAAVAVFGAMHDHGLTSLRTTRTWIEFLKARYLLDPTYYQFDRARVAVDPRDVLTGRDLSAAADRHDSVTRLDRIRLSVNAFQREPFWSHLVRQQSYPNMATEELLCADMVGLARSNDRQAILGRILADQYGILVDDDEARPITGGRDFLPGSPLRPTPRLMAALVESLGSMAEVSLAMQLVDFVSRRYGLPIPRDVWSSLLSWTYVGASKKLRRMRRIHPTGRDAHVDTRDVLHVWRVMVSEPYAVEPSFEDLDVHIRSLIITRRVRRAISLIRHSAVPYHDSLVTEFETALFDEILLKDAASFSPSSSSSSSSTISKAIHRRRQLETKKDHVANRMAIWLDDILRTTSQVSRLRRSTVTTALIPNLVRDFPHLFYRGVRYRTATGEVSIRHVDREASRCRWASMDEVERRVLPAKLGSHLVGLDAVDRHGNPRAMPGVGPAFVENPDFEWPVVEPLRVLQRRRTPRTRIADVACPPVKGAAQADRRRWWGDVKMQLMM
ncbi:hypothetical protein GMORB2_4453 [Geosmithia morbida]|uniref:Uncharacterized protein n=1 Tax=Geosmithia morbida TaxID=1094350 RepID=A0A9P4YNP2_9HYPO|nr:uncharacterized protein GMORB2_4453 [Geosmithia morbida]KAF4119787.1 hypothetical protein GMORB2_4453 [Geosmithia morbida]